MIRLQVRLDLTAYRLRQPSTSRQQGLALIEQTRQEILELYPAKETVFDVILQPRFMRILDERALTEWGKADARN